MGARIRANGEILCAAMHPAEPGDAYIGDDELYTKSISGDWVASAEHLHRSGCTEDLSCPGEIISASGYPVCGDGVWTATTAI